MRAYKLKLDRVPPHRRRVYRLESNHPASIDLRNKMPPVYDQGPLGSCTAQAWCALAAYYFQKAGIVIDPSRLFLYYQERAIEGNTDDSGASLEDGDDALHHIGVCGENLWPYDPSKFAEKPPKQCYDDAFWHRLPDTKHLSDASAIRPALAAGLPVVLGMLAYESFESAEVAGTGRLPMPKADEKLLGGHCVLAVGYDQDNLLIRNSWGPSWGDQGHFWMPNEFLNTYCPTDFYVAL